MKILLLSAYDAVSHQYWHKGLRLALPEHQWTLLTLPARYFSWRVRGNSLTWSGEARHILCAGHDLIVATSMVDLATLRGLVPELAAIPTLLYFHENQFAYPPSARQRQSVEPQMVSLYSSLCATRLAFNSHYNRHSFLDGLAALLRKLPDGVPAGLVEELARKSLVLPVPLQLGPAPPAQVAASDRFQVLWNHRWEYDKGPDLLLTALSALDGQMPLRVHVVGQQFRQQPEVFSRIKALLQARGWLGCWGYVAELDRYQALLHSSQVVLSTALHDFQGLAVLEAAAAGCLPLVPDRLAYPEIFSPEHRYRQASADDVVDLTQRLGHWYRAWQVGALPAAPDLSAWAWPAWAPRYRAVLQALAAPAEHQ